jgi:hypothetical protein
MVNTLRRTYYASDAAFDKLYPERIRSLSRRHWTPMEVARKSALFLANVPGKKILDIGSGVGKFCLIGAQRFPNASFYGIEQREELYDHAIAAKMASQVNNAEFILGNFTQVDFSEYDNFYFYNAFFENLDKEDRIDEEVEHSASLYVYYSRYLFNALDSRPAGTRLVSFHSLDEVPVSYQLVEASDDFLLKMYIKR